MRFRDREQAGRVLAQSLGRYAELPGVVVLGLPRGGVPVACEVAHALGAPLDVVVVRERAELARREAAYRGNRPPLAVDDRVVILVDDGLATGSTMLAAARAVKLGHPRRVVVAVPVAAVETCRTLRSEVDDVVCAMTPEPFRAVGLWYDDFSQVSDGEVRALLDAAWGAEV